MNTNAQHTPGPWSVSEGATIKSEKAGIPEHLTLAVWSNGARPICSLSPMICADAEDRANAMVISKAPAMLAALRDLVESSTPYREEDAHFDLDNEDAIWDSAWYAANRLVKELK